MSPKLTLLDLLIGASFFTVVIGLGMWKSRRARDHAEDTADFFLAGRGLTWPLIGISIVAANISTEQMVGMAGQAAGATGLAVSCWQLMGSVFIVIIAMTLLPRFLRAGIYTMPEFLAYRYNASAQAIMAIITVVIYAVVMLPAVLYSGGVTLRAIAGMPLVQAVWLIGAIATALQCVRWTQGDCLGRRDCRACRSWWPVCWCSFSGLNAVGGWESFATANADKLHMILPASNPELPWTGVLGGMWIVMIYYCGLNQFIVQRNLAAKSLQHGQLGMIFAGALWLLVPFAIVMPGLIAQQLYADRLTATPDAAFPTLITQLIPSGVRGFVYAAIAGAVTSTLASLLNSASTIATMDVYRNMIHKTASQTVLVWLGRALTILFVVAGCWVAPMLDNPKFGGVFQYIQQFQGYIWPGVVAAFLGALVLPRAPAAAGITALLLGPIAYGALQFTAKSDTRPWGHEIHFLLQVLLAFAFVAALMLLITLARPLPQPKVLPERADFDMRTAPVVLVSGLAVIIGVALFFWRFW